MHLSSYKTLLFLILTTPMFSYSQDVITCSDQTLPCFEVVGGVTRGCVPFTITVQECTAGACDNFLYDFEFGSGLPSTPATTYTYNTSGIYTIRQRMSCGGEGCILEKINYIEVLDSPIPTFDFEYCSGRQVILNISDTNYEEYIIDWGDSSSETVAVGAGNVLHTYPNTNNFTITVTGNYVPGNCGASATVNIIPVEDLPITTIPNLTVTEKSTSTGKVQIAFDTDSRFTYQLQLRESGTSSFTDVTTFSGVSGMQVHEQGALNTTNSIFCFRIQTIDDCGNIVNSEERCAISLEAEAQDRRNVVDWSEYPLTSFQEYQLYKDGSLLATITDRSESSYIDSTVVCNQEYCYHVVALVGTAGATQSTSNTECITAFSSEIPPAITQLNSSVENNGSISLSWTGVNEASLASYQVNRSDSTWTINTFTESALDPNVSIDENQYCYEISYQDACENQSPITSRTCPVLLQADLVLADRINLSWSAYENSEGNFERYILEKLDENANVSSSEDKATTQIHQDNSVLSGDQVLRYRIRTIIDESTGLESFSNILVIEQKFRLFVPNAFTPNNDGLNDIFKPEMLFIKNFRMNIYNRAGELLFETTDLEGGWDGTYNGSLASSDSYVYVIEVEDFREQKFQKNGTFVLIH